MIKVIIHVAKAAIAALVALICFSCSMGTKIEGSGKVITQNRPAKADFTSISASNAIEVVLQQGSNNSIVVEADDNLQEHIKTEINNGELKISSDGNIGDGVRKVTVTMTEIESIEADAASSVTAKNIIKSESITLSAEGAASINLTVEANDVTCETGGASTIKINGKTDKLDTESSGSSTIDAKGLVANNVSSDASSASTTMVNPIEKFIANASSAAKILYVATPGSLDKKTSSGGTVAQE
jgi:anti-sigma28 factor (negative regulator of flagellin synthesis)